MTTLWTPNPGRQTEAFVSPAFELLYGGAAGGGKSDLILGLAIREHRHSLLLRRTYPELEDSLILRSNEILQGYGQYNAAKHVWRLPSGGRIRFGHLEHEKHVHRYQSAAFDLIAFDEVTQFTRFQYEYLLSRVRTTRSDQRCRVVAATNPGGEGNDWVMERWAAWLDEGHPDPAEPGELRWYRRNDEGQEVACARDDPDAHSRTFIPAALQDNPYLGDTYRRTLAALPEPLRSQLLTGDWAAGLTDDAYQVIPTAWIRAAMNRWDPTDQDGYPLSLGVDVARGGDDKTVLARRYGPWFAPLEEHPGAMTPDGQSVAGLMALALADGGQANIDVIGVGASAFDIAAGQGLPVTPINFSVKSREWDASGQLRFVNRRAECWWRLREALRPIEPGETREPLALPNDPELLGDLRAPRWKMQSNGVQIESKEDIRKRIGRSPDKGDAVVLALHDAGPAIAMI